MNDEILLCILNILMSINVLFITEILFGIMPEGNRLVIKHIALLCFFIIVNILVEIIGISDNAQFVIIFLSMVSALFYTSGFHFRSVLYVIPAILIDTEFSTVAGLVEKVMGIDKYTIFCEGKDNPVLSYLFDIPLCAVLIIILYIMHKKGIFIRLNVGETILVTVFMVFIPVIDGGMDEIIKNSGKYTMMLGWTAFIVIINIALFYGIIHRSIARTYKELSNKYREQYELAVKGANARKLINENDIRIGHDMKNHFIVIRRMIADGEFEEAGRYLDSIKKQGYAAGVSTTGSPIADIIISANMDEMRENDIAFETMGDMSCFGFMDDMDMTSMFANLFDNAVAACEQMERGRKRYILIQSIKSGDMIMLSVKNSYDEGASGVKADGVKAYSVDHEFDRAHNSGKIPPKNIRKKYEDKKLRDSGKGIGIRQIKQVVEKYNGEYEVIRKEGEYNVRIRFVI